MNLFKLFKQKKNSHPDTDHSFPSKDELKSIIPWKAEMSPVETWRLDEFYKKHRDCIHNNFGAIGGGLTVECTGTGLGWIFTVKCNKCGKRMDITDTTTW